MEIPQLTDFIQMIQRGHSVPAAASQLTPALLPNEVLDFLNQPEQSVWLRSFQISQNIALFNAEKGYLSANPSTRNFQAELAARAPDEWRFRTSSPSSRERQSRTESSLPSINFNPPSQLFNFGAVPYSAPEEPLHDTSC